MLSILFVRDVSHSWESNSLTDCVCVCVKANSADWHCDATHDN